MKIFKVGDKQKAACDSCQSFEQMTFSLKDAPFSDGSGIVKNVLVGVCDRCDSIGILPQQSAPLIKKGLEVQRKSLESRVPAHMIDILNLASTELSGSIDFVPNLMKYYIHLLATDEKSACNISKYLESELALGKADKRLSLKGRQLSADIDLLKSVTNISNTTNLIKSIILKINDDLLVKRKTKIRVELKNLIAAVA